MEATRRLRDRTQTTRLLILAGLQEPGATLSRVARQLGVTVQAVSAHAQTMARAGHVAPDGPTYKVTPAGLQALHEGVRGLRDAVRDLAAPLEVIQVTSAIAAVDLEKGEEVALWMEDGDLVARTGKGSSRGRTRNAARKGQEVVVGELRGLVPLAPGPLTLVSLPSPEEGGIARVDRAGLEATLKRRPLPARRGALGTGAQVLARAVWDQVDFLFAADAAAFNAAERGLAVTLLVTRDRLPEAMQSLERSNATTLRRVPIEVVEAPER